MESERVRAGLCPEGNCLCERKSVKRIILSPETNRVKNGLLIGIFGVHASFESMTSEAKLVLGEGKAIASGDLVIDGFRERGEACYVKNTLLF